MKKSGKYKASGVESEFEPEARGKILKNLLGVKSQSELDRIENIALKQAEDALFRKLVRKDKRFTAKDICHMHKAWLGKIYAWAGQYRRVNLTKDDFSFATAAHIPDLMQEFESTVLRKWTPSDKKNIAQRITLFLAQRSVA